MYLFFKSNLPKKHVNFRFYFDFISKSCNWNKNGIPNWYRSTIFGRNLGILIGLYVESRKSLGNFYADNETRVAAV